MHILFAFSCSEVLSVLHLGRFHTSPHLIFYLFLLLGFYSLYHIELVLSFPKIPSSSKTDFVWKTCWVFDVGGFTGYHIWRGYTSYLFVNSPKMSLNIFTFSSSSTCRYLSNKIGFISIGVRMRKISSFLCVSGSVGFQPANRKLSRTFRLRGRLSRSETGPSGFG
jgi:hypothetical protein